MHTPRFQWGIVGFALHAATAATSASGASPAEGVWRAWLESPGGALEFGLRIRRSGDEWRAWLINGPEEIPVPRVSWDGETMTLGIDYYAASITAASSARGTRLDGRWRKRAGADRHAELPFHAELGGAQRTTGAPPTPAFAGRWTVRFEKSDEPAVGIFEVDERTGVATGTFLTTLGDYRFLAGHAAGGRMSISCFDGAHAFLFEAELQPDGTIRGDFWSRDTWHETWTARRDDDAELPDGFLLSRSNPNASLDELTFPDLEGRQRSLGAPEFAGRARIVQLFGSWCPNCRDETLYLVELHRRYKARGLSIIGLAFELTGDFHRDAAQVRTYARGHGITYPLLIAGPSDKAEASKRFPPLDRIRAYPTTLFIDARGAVRAVHTGFSGPATGEAHTRLRERFESLIETMLAESGS